MRKNLKEIEIAEKIWQENESYIRKLCNYKLSSHPDFIDDCMQDIFLALITACRDEKEIKNYRAWLTKVTVNKINDFYRDEKKKEEREISLEEENLKASSDFDYSYTEDINEKDLDAHLENILSSLTDREKDVLIEIAHGLNNREIAEKLFISLPTVKTHVAHILKKINARDRVQAVVFAYENHMI